VDLGAGLAAAEGTLQAGLSASLLAGSYPPWNIPKKTIGISDVYTYWETF